MHSKFEAGTRTWRPISPEANLELLSSRQLALPISDAMLICQLEALTWDERYVKHEKT